MRDRLIELIRKSGCVDTWNYYTDDFKEPNPINELADYLLANGVIIPPCKVGDKVYIAAEVTKKIVECTIVGYWVCESNCTVITDCGSIYNLSFDKTVFLTKEEAEQALRKEDEGK